MIEISHLTKRYSGVAAVEDLSLTIAAGEIVCFLGINGAGKTTTLRILAGILMPDEGQATVFGHNLFKEPEAVRRITGYIPDRPYLYPKLTAREHLFFTGNLYGVPKRDLEQRIDMLLDEFSLHRAADQLTESFSHGMKQRLAVCVALLHQPQFLIVDEPLVGLDPHGARHLKDYFVQLRNHNVAILFSTHLLEVAEEIADRVAIIHQGKFLRIGTLQEVRGDTRLEHVFLRCTAEQEGE